MNKYTYTGLGTLIWGGGRTLNGPRLFLKQTTQNSLRLFLEGHREAVGAWHGSLGINSHSWKKQNKPHQWSQEPLGDTVLGYYPQLPFSIGDFLEFLSNYQMLPSHLTMSLELSCQLHDLPDQLLLPGGKHWQEGHRTPGRLSRSAGSSGGDFEAGPVSQEMACSRTWEQHW